MSILFLNSHRAKSGILNGKRLPDAYVLTSKFFDCGVIDRTQSLDTGFEYKVLDEIPDHKIIETPSFETICNTAAKKIINEAIATDKSIQILWSGGIDSTVALISLMKNLPEALHLRLEILLTMTSINEYSLFFRDFILNKYNFRVIKPPITDNLNGNALVVTGEHGDQLFGSDKLLPLMQNQLAYEHYETILPIYLMNKFGSAKKVDALIDYLQPLILACPNPIHTTFELFWWLNFTIKWQQVALRLAVFSFKKNVKPLFERLHHFYRDEQFQIWSLNNHEDRVAPDIYKYKYPAKKIIFDYTNDPDYLTKKSKEPSLKNVIVNRQKQGNARYRVMMEEDFKPVIESFDKKFKNQKIVS